MDVTVTGAAGYIGSRLVAELDTSHPDWTVRAVDDFSNGRVDTVGSVDIQNLDIRDRDPLEDALAGTDAVVHLAAVSGVDGCADDPDRCYEVNVVGTENVAWFCRKTGTALSFPSSMAVIGDPETFPITTGHPRDPLNWYGRTKVINEGAIDTFADGAFPAHQFLIANVYGDHQVGDRRVSKPSVINLFAGWARDGDPLTVHEPGTQARNYVHVNDVARAFVKCIEHLIEQSEAGDTGVERFAIGTDEDPSVLEVAELVQRIGKEEAGADVEIDRIENPRPGETLVTEFGVDTTDTRRHLGWTPRETIEETVRSLLTDDHGEGGRSS